jgi:hypothetical protein
LPQRPAKGFCYLPALKTPSPVIVKSLPFELLPPGDEERIAHVGARGHLLFTENGLQIVYHRFTALLVMEQHETYFITWADIKSVRLDMSLFSATLKLSLKNDSSVEGVSGLKENGIQLLVHRGYRNDAREMLAIIEKALSKSRIEHQE